MKKFILVLVSGVFLFSQSCMIDIGQKDDANAANPNGGVSISDIRTFITQYGGLILAKAVIGAAYSTANALMSRSTSMETNINTKGYVTSKINQVKDAAEKALAAIADMKNQFNFISEAKDRVTQKGDSISDDDLAKLQQDVQDAAQKLILSFADVSVYGTVADSLSGNNNANMLPVIGFTPSYDPNKNNTNTLPVMGYFPSTDPNKNNNNGSGGGSSTTVPSMGFYPSTMPMTLPMIKRNGLILKQTIDALVVETSGYFTTNVVNLGSSDAHLTGGSNAKSALDAANGVLNELKAIQTSVNTAYQALMTTQNLADAKTKESAMEAQLTTAQDKSVLTIGNVETAVHRGLAYIAGNISDRYTIVKDGNYQQNGLAQIEPRVAPYQTFVDTYFGTNSAYYKVMNSNLPQAAKDFAKALPQAAERNVSGSSYGDQETASKKALTDMKYWLAEAQKVVANGADLIKQAAANNSGSMDDMITKMIALRDKSAANITDMRNIYGHFHQADQDGPTIFTGDAVMKSFCVVDGKNCTLGQLVGVLKTPSYSAAQHFYPASSYVAGDSAMNAAKKMFNFSPGGVFYYQEMQGNQFMAFKCNSIDPSNFKITCDTTGKNGNYSYSTSEAGPHYLLNTPTKTGSTYLLFEGKTPYVAHYGI